MGKTKTGLRYVALASAGALALAACGGGSGGGSPNASGSAGASGEGTRGGTITFLANEEQIAHLDPQRNYTGEDLAFSSAYLTRTLTAYAVSKDGVEAGKVVPDLATDTGTPTDGGKTWAFTLKDGSKFEDGSPITCADVKYGVSRTFAQTVITDGPSYAISLLDIPKDAEGNSTYKGPYETAKNDTAAFDKAVECSSDNKTVTFHLGKPAGDFNYTTTLTAFSPVPKAKDTGEKYDDKPVSSGPYKITEYTKGQQLVLDRNPNWDAKQDTYRHDFPDKIVYKFSLDDSVIDQRLQADAGPDQSALQPTFMTTASLTTVFNDPRFADRRVNEFDPYVRYIAINVKKVPNLKHRQAILAAADRKQLLTIAGGSYAGDLADGVIKPNLPADYAPSGLWDNLLGDKVPDTGNPELAKKLIAESGAPMPALTYDYGKRPDADKGAAALQSSLAKAGIKLNLNGIEPGKYYATVLAGADKENELAAAGWGPDWSNASTVIPELFTTAGGFDLTHADDKDFTAKSDAAKAETDRAKQGATWKELNKTAMQNAWVLPTRFGREQRLAGSKVGSVSGGGKVYIWAPYGSWSYSDLYVKK